MAAITAIVPQPGDLVVFRNATAQANTGQTDWFDVPFWAEFARFSFNLTAVAGGGTPQFTPSIKYADPIARNDTYSMNLGEHTAFTAITAANMLIVDVGPGITGIANDVTNSATVASWASINAFLPSLMGVTILLNHPAAETYTYTASVHFKLPPRG